MADLIRVDVNFPFRIYKVSGKNAYQAWKNLTQKQGQTAVIIGPKDELEFLKEALDIFRERTTEEILEAANNLDFPQQFQKEKHAELRQFIQEYGDKTELAELGDFDPQHDAQALVDNWPREPIAGNSQTDPAILRHWETNDFHSEIFIAVLDTDDSTEIPAYLKYGHFNDCPKPEWHVAAARYWRDKYDAKIVVNSHDTIEMIVKTRPTNKVDAAKLAIEQYAYCGDIIDQGIGDPGLLAKSLTIANWWFFWWD